MAALNPMQLTIAVLSLMAVTFSELPYFNTLGRGQLTAALRLPMAWFYLPIAISGVLLILRYLWVISEVWNKPPVSLSEELVAESDKLV